MEKVEDKQNHQLRNDKGNKRKNVQSILDYDEYEMEYNNDVDDEDNNSRYDLINIFCYFIKFFLLEIFTFLRFYENIFSNKKNSKKSPQLRPHTDRNNSHRRNKKPHDRHHRNKGFRSKKHRNHNNRHPISDKRYRKRPKQQKNAKQFAKEINDESQNTALISNYNYINLKNKRLSRKLRMVSKFLLEKFNKLIQHKIVTIDKFVSKYNLNSVQENFLKNAIENYYYPILSEKIIVRLLDDTTKIHFMEEGYLKETLAKALAIPLNRTFYNFLHILCKAFSNYSLEELNDDVLTDFAKILY